jgi:hypothetical protein
VAPTTLDPHDHAAIAGAAPAEQWREMKKDRAQSCDIVRPI